MRKESFFKCYKITEQSRRKTRAADYQVETKAKKSEAIPATDRGGL
jgi:hypothetical protein